MQVLSGIIKDEIAGVISTPLSLINPIFNRGENRMTATTISKICSVDGCDRKVHAHGYCGMHAIRVYKYGNTTTKFKAWGRSDDEIVADFWAAVVKTDTCWEWTGMLRRGYGRLSVRGRLESAHIFSWMLTYGQRPAMRLLHSCDNKACVNPAHLREGTQAENVHEACDRGLHPRGDANGSAKLTTAKVMEIRERKARGETYAAMARELGMHQSVISRAARGLTWSHI